MVVISYLFIKVLQEAEISKRKLRSAKMSPEEHREYRNKIVAAITPFPENEHHEQETTEQSEKIYSGRTSGK